MFGLAGLALSGCAATPAPVVTVPAGMQYLYGSGEAAALSRQAYAGLADYVRASSRAAPVSVVEGAGPCGAKPRAIVLDVDETALLNLGYEYADGLAVRPYDPARWERWERTGARAVLPVPGAVDALAAVRAQGVTVIFNSNRNAATAEESRAAIEGAGLGPAVHGETLFLKGDAGGGSGKDARRRLISERWCVIAMVGDQLGDFSDRFVGPAPVRRAAAQAAGAGERWGHGWFMLPNPVYGAGLVGTFDDVFPVDRRWADPAARKGAK
ncbi:5'-nucleotidase, lipoprotein e(P4) family [Sphingomonas arantia]|uniref:5'-nucleotidase, lipoprotein e(P4) family n=1 Tax=Sphingomonas arantia TaxID=1460676 RepID=A0ABW4TTS3_9SPHN